MSWVEPGYWEMLVRRSLSRFFMLRVLADQPAHGYRLKDAVRRACAGCCEPSDAMIYNALGELIKDGYVRTRVESQGARERKVCTLTPRGVQAFKAAAAVWESVLPHIQEAVEAARLAKPQEVNVHERDPRPTAEAGDQTGRRGAL